MTKRLLLFFLAWPSQDVFLLPHIPWIGQGGSILLVHYSMIVLKPDILIIMAVVRYNHMHWVFLGGVMSTWEIVATKEEWLWLNGKRGCFRCQRSTFYNPAINKIFMINLFILNWWTHKMKKKEAKHGPLFFYGRTNYLSCCSCLNYSNRIFLVQPLPASNR